MVELAQSQARHLQPVHCRAICHEIGERLRLALDQDRLPLPSRLRDVLDRFEEGDALARLHSSTQAKDLQRSHRNGR